MKERKIFALGFFDGVHLGHQALLHECRRLANLHCCQAAAVTFDLPPRTVLQNTAAQMINTVQDRHSLLHEYGMESVLTLPATSQTLATPWEDFLRQLMEQGAVGFVCGEDYRFGEGGLGNANLLADFAEKQGLACAIVPQQEMDGLRISSSRIRTLLEMGDLEYANRLLGHPHRITGKVVSGKQLGRSIGIPTANVHLPQELLVPKLGVYACLAKVDRSVYPAVTNIGTRPTVAGDHITAEAWLQNFSADLYGKELTLELHAFLRPEKKFPTLQALKKEILKNRQETLDLFEKK